MKDILRNPRAATIAVALGLGGLGVAGCSSSEQSEAPQPIEEFNLCPPHAYKAIQVPPQAEAHASAITGADALACFILRKPLPTAELDKSDHGGVVARFTRKAPSLLNPGYGKYITSVTAPSLQAISHDLFNRDRISPKTLDGVSVKVTTGQKTLFSYDLFQQDGDWRLRSSTLDKGGAYHRFNQLVDSSSDSKVRTLGNVAALAACWEQKSTPVSYFHPDYIGHHAILENCMVDTIGTPKP